MTQILYGRVRGVIAVEQKPFQVGVVMAESEVSPWPNRSLYNLALSWLSTRRYCGQVEGFPTPHRHGGIGNFTAAE